MMTQETEKVRKQMQIVLTSVVRSSSANYR